MTIKQFLNDYKGNHLDLSFIHKSKNRGKLILWPTEEQLNFSKIIAQNNINGRTIIQFVTI